MSLAGELVVRVRAESTGLDTQVSEQGSRAGRAFSAAFNRSSKGAFGTVEKELNQSTRGLAAGSGLAAGLGRSLAFASAGFLTTASAVKVLRDSLTEAADEQKQVERASALFGGASRNVEAFAKTAALAIGLSRDETMKFTNDLGQMLVPLGIAPGKAAAYSVELTKLVGNLAAMRNEDPSLVLSKIEAGLRGRGMGLKAYGIQINDVTLKEEALRLGLVKSAADEGKIAAARTTLAIRTAQLKKAQADYGAGTTQVASAQQAVAKAQDAVTKAVNGAVPALTQQQKSIAAVNLIMQAGVRYQGEYGKHAGDLANIQRQLSAEFKNLEGTIGTALLPMFTHATKAVVDWLDQSKNQARVQRDVTTAVHDFAVGLKTAWDVISTGVSIIRPVVGAVGGLKHAIELLLAVKLAAWVSSVVIPSLATTSAAWVTVGTAATGAATATTAATATITADMAALAGSTATRTFATGIGAIGAAAAGSAAKVGLLSGALAGLAALATKVFAVGGAGVAVRQPAQVPGFIQANADEIRGAFYRIGSKWYYTAAGGRQRGPFSSYAAATKDAGLAAPAVTAAVQAATAGPTAAITSGQNTLPATFTATHETSGLPGFPAIDIFRDPGTVIGSPVNGVVTRLSGHDPALGSIGAAGVLGYSIYIQADDGDTYFLTHFAKILVKPGQRVRRGQPIGTVAFHPRGSHIHEGRHAGTVTPSAATAPSIPSTSTAASSTAGLVVGAKAAAATLPDVVSMRLGNQLQAAQRGVTAAAAKGPSAQEQAIRAQIAVDEKIIEAAHEYLRKHPKEKKAVNDVIQARLDDITQLKADLARLEKEQAKTAAARKVHEDLVDQVLAGAGMSTAGFSQAAAKAREQVRAGYEKMTDSALSAIQTARAKAKQQLVAAQKSVQGAIGEAKDVIGTLLGFDPSTVVTSSDKFGREITTTIGAVVQKARTALQQLQAVGGSSSKAAKDAMVRAWQTLGAELSAAIGAGISTAQAAAQARMSAFEGAFSALSGQILTGFDRQTAAGLAAMQASAQAQIQAVQNAAAAQIQSIQAAAAAHIQSLQNKAAQQIQGLQDRLQAKIKQLQKTLQRDIDALERQRAQPTIAEQRLATFQAGRSTAANAATFADLQQGVGLARLGGDPQAIKDAVRSLQDFIDTQTEAGLQKAADASRAQEDESIKTQQDALTKKEQQLEESLTKQEAAAEAQIQKELDARIAAINKATEARVAAINAQTEAQVAAINAEEAAREQEYQDQRTAERTQLEATLNDWAVKIATGKASWTDFENWLKNNESVSKTAGGINGAAFAREYVRMLAAAYAAQQALLSGGDPSSVSIPKPSGGSGPPLGCFVADTPISTPDGDRPISTIAVGDLVLVPNLKTGVAAAAVADVFFHESVPTLNLNTDAGTVVTTAEHPFWTSDGWTKAADLQPGALLRRLDGGHTTLNTVQPGPPRPVYNFHVDHPGHCYFAGGVLVHNKQLFAEGGEVPGPYTGKDDTFALLSGGETVIDRRTTRALKSFLAGVTGGDGSEALNMIVEVLRRSYEEHKKQTDLLERPIRVSANGRGSNEIAFEATR